MTAHDKHLDAVYDNFRAIATIPHGSGNTAQISRFCVDWAHAHRLDVSADAAGNVVIRKPASKGYESRPAVILQGHLDMVCAKDDNCRKDMETEGLTLCWGREFLSAQGTTLGGDDGIAVAYALALLAADDIPHPPLTVLLTVDEEIGMLGAAAVSPSALDADYLLNLDSEEEGVFTVGCAGGVRVHLTVPVNMEKQQGVPITVKLSGLCGGHSGMEIHRPLMNANTAMVRVLQAISAPFGLCGWEGGIRDNVIPTEASVTLHCQADKVQDVLDAVENAGKTLAVDYPLDTDMKLTAAVAAESEHDAMDAEETTNLLAYLESLPNGVTAMDETLHMPQTSLNQGIFSLHDGAFHTDALVRSGINAEKDALANKLHKLALGMGGGFEDSGDYPAWEYIPNTVLEQTAVACYRNCYDGKEPLVQTIHAGLECGVLAAKSEHLTCISFGPDILDIHTPRERLSLPSVARTWTLLCEILAHLGE